MLGTVVKIATPGKGILAADESTGTMGKRLAAVKTENTAENRRSYRNLLFTTEGLENYISGVILFEETIYQSSNNKKDTLIHVLMQKGIVPIIKVDKGLKDLPGCIDEPITIGLDDLDNRCKEFYSKGITIITTIITTIIIIIIIIILEDAEQPSGELFSMSQLMELDQAACQWMRMLTLLGGLQVSVKQMG